MENTQALVDQKSNSSLPTALNKPESEIFAAAVMKMALAKNIALAPGTLKVWEECALEDQLAGHYDLKDFIAATKKVIRQPLFNRIDFADIYTEAVEIAKTRKVKGSNALKLSVGTGVPMPQDLRERIGAIGNFGKEEGTR